jgi:glycosyltransferase involved in cell wall biosynthesis
MRKIRIVYLVTCLSAGGAETMLVRLLRTIDRDRFDPVVISLMDGRLRDAIESLGVPVHALGLRQGQVTPGAFFRLITLIRKERPDIVQGWMYHGNLAAQVVSLFSGRPIVCWCIHGSFDAYATETPLTRLVIWVSARLSKLPAKIVFVSKESVPAFRDIGFEMHHSCVIPNGFDTGDFRPSTEARSSVRTELGIGVDAPLIGMMARYHPQKDHENFCNAAALIARERTDVHFLLAGNGVTQENPTLMRALRRHGIEGRVHLLGERVDVPRLTAALDIATLSSSRGEAFPLAIGEAMSCGVPCVVTDVGDGAFTVGGTGVVIPPRNAEALAAGWNQLLSAGAEERRRLGEAARRRIQENFSLTTTVRKYEDLYTSLLTVDAEKRQVTVDALFPVS